MPQYPADDRKAASEYYTGTGTPADPDAVARWVDEGGTTVEAPRDKRDPATGRKWSEKHQAFLPKPPDTAAVLRPQHTHAVRRVEIVECENGYVLMLDSGANTEYEIHTSAEAATAHAEEFLCDD